MSSVERATRLESRTSATKLNPKRAMAVGEQGASGKKPPKGPHTPCLHKPGPRSSQVGQRTYSLLAEISVTRHTLEQQLRELASVHEDDEPQQASEALKEDQKFVEDLRGVAWQARVMLTALQNAWSTMEDKIKHLPLAVAAANCSNSNGRISPTGLRLGRAALTSRSRRQSAIDELSSPLSSSLHRRGAGSVSSSLLQQTRRPGRSIVLFPKSHNRSELASVKGHENSPPLSPGSTAFPANHKYHSWVGWDAHSRRGSNSKPSQPVSRKQTCDSDAAGEGDAPLFVSKYIDMSVVRTDKGELKLSAGTLEHPPTPGGAAAAAAAAAEGHAADISRITSPAKNSDAAASTVHSPQDSRKGSGNLETFLRDFPAGENDNAAEEAGSDQPRLVEYLLAYKVEAPEDTGGAGGEGAGVEVDEYPVTTRQFPAVGHADCPVPENVSLFALSVAPRTRRPKDEKARTRMGQPLFFPLVLTGGDGQRMYASCCHYYEQLEGVAEELYGARCLVLLSNAPFFDTFRQIMTHMYRLRTQPKQQLQAERLVTFLTQELLLPMPGGPAVKFKLGEGLPPLQCALPGDEELPLLDLGLDRIFRQLSVANVVLLFSAVMMERQVVFYSKSYSNLTMCAESVQALMWPFKWHHVYIPVVPEQLLDVVDAPVPYILGLHSSYLHFIPPDTLQSVVLCDIDNNRVKISDEIMESLQLPQAISETLTARLSELVEQYPLGLSPEALPLVKATTNSGNSGRDSGGESPADGAVATHTAPTGNDLNCDSDHYAGPKVVHHGAFQQGVRQAFFEVLPQLLGGYRKTVFFMGDGIPIFNAEAFIQAREAESQKPSTPSSKPAPVLLEGPGADFLPQLLQSQLFAWFLESSSERHSLVHDAISDPQHAHTRNFVSATPRPADTQPFELPLPSSVVLPDADGEQETAAPAGRGGRLDWTTLDEDALTAAKPRSFVSEYFLHASMLKDEQLMPSAMRRRSIVGGSLSVRKQRSEWEDALQNYLSLLFLGSGSSDQGVDYVSGKEHLKCVQSLRNEEKVRVCLGALLNQPQNKKRKMRLEMGAFKALRELVYALLEACMEHGDYANARQMLDAGGTFYRDRCEEDDARARKEEEDQGYKSAKVFTGSFFLENAIKEHKICQHTPLWDAIMNADIAKAKKEGEEEEADPTKRQGLLHALYVGRIGSLVNTMLTYGVPIENVLEFVSGKCIALGLKPEEQRTLEKLSINITLALTMNDVVR